MDKIKRDELIYTETKRSQIGPCNICGKKSILGWDHVPPQGAIELSSVEIKSILQNVAPDKSNEKFIISQNGLKYRTLCKECNNMLGREFDPILNEFSKGVGAFLKTSISLPPIVHFKTKPNAIIRAILGHLLAAKAHFDHAVIDECIRSFIFDMSASLPRSINVFFWVYPYRNIVVLRNILMPAVRGRFKEFANFDILKYFPIAYLVADKSQYEGLNEFSAFRNEKTFQEVDVPINLKSVRDPDWPEKIEDGNFLIGGQSLTSSVIARPRKRKGLAG
ncbi:MAG: hypothetical protein ABR936_16565 [Bacteroidota bacterium]|jgi:hypothetical protein